MPRNTPIQNLEQGKDVLWTHNLPISLDFQEASRIALINQVMELENESTIQIVNISDTDEPFSALLPDQNMKRSFWGVSRYSQTQVGSSYYFPYKAGIPNEDFINTVGNVEVLIKPTLNDPHYVMTGAMNGCAIIITKEKDQNINGQPSFTAWHFQSPTSYRPSLRAFIKRYRHCIYSYLCFRDYAAPNLNDGYYDDGNVEGFNYLFYNRSTFSDNGNPQFGVWELNCIPLKRMARPPSKGEWKKTWVAKSIHPRSKRLIDFNKPIDIPNDEVIEWIIWDITLAVERPEDQRPQPPITPPPSGLPPKTITEF